MQKKIYPLIIVLFVLLFVSGSQAQERLWGITADAKLYSTEADGSDRRVVNLDSIKYGLYVSRLIQLDNGNLIFITESEGAFYNGTICLITPDGIEKLYDVEDYYPRFVNNMVYGGDGFLYGLRGNVMGPDYVGVNAFKIDGTKALRGSFGSTKLLNTEPLVVTSDGIYGTSHGSGNNKGFIFKINKQTLATDNVFSFSTDVQGIRPFGKLTEGRDGKLYGTTRIGGVANQGVVFSINKDGTQYSKLYDFRQETGMNPESALVQDSNGMFYGTTTKGGRKGWGVLFSITESGQYTKIFDFFEKGIANYNDDLFLGADGFIYGRKSNFKVKPDGTGFATTPSPAPIFKLEVNFLKATVVNPANGSQGLPVNLVVQVKPVKAAASYDLQMSTTSDFSGTISTFSNADPRFNFKNLAYNTTYFVRARSSVSPSFGEISSFTTGPAQPLADIYLVNPGNQKSDKPIFTTYDVKAVPGGSQYVLELSEFADFSSGVIHMESSGTTFPGIELKYETVYYARAKSNTTDFGQVTSFTTRTLLKYTFLSGPKGGATNVPVDSINVTANNIIGATNYAIDLTTIYYDWDPYFYPERELRSTRPGQRTFFLDLLNYGTTYYARVKTDRHLDWGEVRSFTTVYKEFKTLLPVDGQINVPVNNVRVETEKIRAGGYSFYVGEDPDNPYANYFQSTYTPNNFATFSGLKYNTRYYVFVTHTRTPYFNRVISFTTQAAPGSLMAKASVYPNSSPTSFTVEEGASPIKQIIVTNANGMTVLTANGEGDKMSFGNELQKGIYYLKVVTSEGVETHRLVKE